MRRLIDANALMDAFRSYMVERYDREKCVSEENCKTCEKSCLWRKIVSIAPTVDAVEVGRCKGCYYYESSNPGHGYCKYFDTLRIDNDFCSSWERKGNETD